MFQQRWQGNKFYFAPLCWCFMSHSTIFQSSQDNQPEFQSNQSKVKMQPFPLAWWCFTWNLIWPTDIRDVLLFIFEQTMMVTDHCHTCWAKNRLVVHDLRFNSFPVSHQGQVTTVCGVPENKIKIYYSWSKLRFCQGESPRVGDNCVRCSSKYKKD